MAVVSLFSFSGAPGVTTAAIASMYSWPRPAIVLEADTSRPSAVLPGLLEGQHDHSRGLSGISVAQQRGELTPQTVVDEAVAVGESRWVVPGFSNQAAGAGTTALWGELAGTLSAFNSAAMDVIIDLGRLVPGDARLPLLQVSDAVVLVIEPVLPDIAAAAPRMPEIRERLRQVGREDALALLTVQVPYRGYTAAEVQAQLGIPAIGEIAHDSRNAAVYSLGAPAGSRFASSEFVKSTRAAVFVITQRLREREIALGYRPAATRGGAA
ncbi:MAG: hypothetical protein DI536_35955 [Archangium gephyra]|uniref:Cellulose biosynthesis protein BcsQ n=1 Tax=Archangium gephyra TaxID=48 RepID=A0A2W5SJV2_9BACT|nr:MAG: hypothetical protein DI536_35955 [Archangium gephyra]